ncbi:hypothetical protein PPROV_000158200 [Pycnococcus provasolii]|uniref:Uncharacterized protein n=1 Tax=Pycnococcus provasolii TaxID=41880 RepID=A0A830HCL0_9CHLO|nr:hypothetical protein PPROV_000158200 [Pycnococcus provasolii]
MENDLYGDLYGSAGEADASLQPGGDADGAGILRVRLATAEEQIKKLAASEAALKAQLANAIAERDRFGEQNEILLRNISCAKAKLQSSAAPDLDSLDAASLDKATSEDAFSKPFGAETETTSSSSTPASPFGDAPPASPFGAAPPASPFGAAPPANPFGAAPTTPTTSSPFGEAPPAAGGKRELGQPLRDGLSMDDSIRARLREEDPDFAADVPWWQRITITQVVIVLSFAASIGLMFATFQVVWNSGAIHFNDI